MEHTDTVWTQAEGEPGTRIDFFFRQAMPQIKDADELKVVMSIYYLLRQRQGVLPFVTYEDLASHAASVLKMDEPTVKRALDQAVNRGVILRGRMVVDGEWRDAYFANMDPDRGARGEVGARSGGSGDVTQERGEPQSIFTLYEQNIGMITPMVGEELKEARRQYPRQWIEEAFREAVMLNKRSWRYVVSILERWVREGKQSGASRQGARAHDPDKYIKGKYGHLVRR
ncbi:MAG: DnaD domain-containing protein [Chloroflexota bacterium]